MKVTVKRKSGTGAVYRNLSGDKRWRNTRQPAARSRNQRKVIRATLNPRNVRKGV